jgi:glycosyltransferase involved in cell wall biosynthesis
VIEHPQNRGYGGNQKTCYTLALSEGADIVVMIHPDYQYDSSLTKKLIEPIIDGRFDIMFGSRIRTRAEALAGGMPWWKYVANRFLTTIENVVLGYNLSEYHTGFRAFSRKTLEQLPFHRYSDNFVFDQDIIMGAVAKKCRIGEIHVPVRYFEEASSANFWQSTVYGLAILKDLVLYLTSGGKWFL